MFNIKNWLTKYFIITVTTTTKKKKHYPYHHYNPFPDEIEERRGRPPIAAMDEADRKCEKCNIVFISKKEKKKHISEVHRI